MHAHHGMVADCTAVQDGAVTDGGALTDDERDSPCLRVPTTLSWTLALRCTMIGAMSPRRTTPYQMLAPSSTVTSPISTAVSATNAVRCYDWGLSVECAKNPGHQCPSM